MITTVEVIVTHVSVSEVPDSALERDRLSRERAHVGCLVLEVRTILLEHRLVVAKVLILTCKKS